MTAPAAPPTEASDTTPANVAIAARLSAGLERLRATLGAPGASAAFLRANSDPICVAVGLANSETAAPMTVNHRLLGGSTGKSLLAATALKLSLDGVIDLDAPLIDSLGAHSWFRALPNAKDLTLRRLLRQSSGLPDHMGLPNIMDVLAQKVRMDGPDAYLSPLEAVALVAGMTPIHPAGEGFFYSDTAYVVAGLALEAATGSGLFDLTAAAILQPLRMTRTIHAVSRRIPDLATPHLDFGGGVRPALDASGDLIGSPRTEWAGGGYATTPLDLARFMAAYAGGYAFATPYLDQVLDLNRYSWSPGHVGAYGLGVFVSETSLGRAIGHAGYFPGFQSNVVHFAEHGLTVAYQVNASSPFGGYAEIVGTRKEAAAQPPASDAPLTVADDAIVKLAMAALDV